MLPNCHPIWPLYHTQVLRGTTAGESGTAESSFWLYRSGGMRLAVDVKVCVWEVCFFLRVFCVGGGGGVSSYGFVFVFFSRQATLFL